MFYRSRDDDCDLPPGPITSDYHYGLFYNDSNVNEDVIYRKVI